MQKWLLAWADTLLSLQDGLVLLQAFDKIIPGSVTWRRVGKSPLPLSRFKAVENTNYAVDLAKQNRMQMVGIQGADIVDGTRTLVLGLVWQMMRRNILSTMESLSKNGKDVTDSDIIKWANDQVAKAGKRSSMRSFKDSGLKDGKFFLDLLDAIKPGYVDYSLVYDGRTDEECKANGELGACVVSSHADHPPPPAKLAISIARKLGSLIFIVPEDIVDLRPRLILTFTAALSESVREQASETVADTVVVSLSGSALGCLRDSASKMMAVLCEDVAMFSCAWQYKNQE